MNNFNFIAPFYDFLAGLVFGQNIRRATCFFLHKIEEGDRVLVIGGGAGRILTKLPLCGEVTYLERSPKMLALAKARRTNQLVNFVNEDFFNFQTTQTYDFVICPFFLDCFSSASLTEILLRIRTILRKEGHLIVTDFQPGTNSLLLSFMHFFFRIFASLESRELEDIHHFVVQSGFDAEIEEFFHKKMIFSRVYRNL